MQFWKRVKEEAQKHLATWLAALPPILLSMLAALPEKYFPLETIAQIEPVQWLRTVLLLLAICTAAIAYVVYVHPKKKFISRVGAYLELKSGIYLCTKCAAEEKNSPMLETEQGWRCKTCWLWYANPDYKKPPEPRRIDSIE